MRAKKSLGQNFLTNKHIVDDIVRASQVTGSDIVLEIGPGKGILTQALLQSTGTVYAIEKDDELIPLLMEKFTKEIEIGKLILIHGDILAIDLDDILPKTYHVVANIPYYITGQIIRMFLETTSQPKTMTLLVQKEVGDRMVAKNGKESLLSLSIEAYGKAVFVRTVGRGAFSPAPSVDSAVIHIQDISRTRFVDVSEKDFFSIIHAGFAHKRKQLIPNLSQLYSKMKITEIFNTLNIPKTIRAEDIHIDTWIDICKALQ